MKIWYFLVVASLSTAHVRAFDPVEPAPKKTLTWTTSWLGNVRVPKVDFDKTSVQEAIDFFHSTYPEEYRVEIDFSKIDLAAVRKVTYEGKDVTFMEAIGGVAEAAGLNIMIVPGKVYLIPRVSD